MRVVSLDVSRTVAEIAYLENGEVKAGGRAELVHSVLTQWAAVAPDRSRRARSDRQYDGRRQCGASARGACRRGESVSSAADCRSPGEDGQDRCRRPCTAVREWLPSRGLDSRRCDADAASTGGTPGAGCPATRAPQERSALGVAYVSDSPLSGRRSLWPEGSHLVGQPTITAGRAARRRATTP